MKRSKPKRTLYVIAYDIANNRRRTKVHKTLSGFGEWTQFSLFECHLSAKELLQLRERLDKLLKPEHDNVRYYPLCATCASKVDTIGSPKPEEKEVIII